MIDTGVMLDSKQDVCYYVKMLDKLASADGVVEEVENKYITTTINLYANIFQFESAAELREQAKQISDEAVDDWKKTLSAPMKRNLLKDMIALSMCDQDYSEAELAMVKKVASDLEINSDLVNKITASLKVLLEEGTKLQKMITDDEV